MMRAMTTHETRHTTHDMMQIGILADSFKLRLENCSNTIELELVA